MKNKKLESGDRVLLTIKDGTTREGVFVRPVAELLLDGDTKVKYHNIDDVKKIPDKSYDITNAKAINGGWIMPNGDFVSEDEVNMDTIEKSM